MYTPTGTHTNVYSHVCTFIYVHVSYTHSSTKGVDVRVGINPYTHVYTFSFTQNDMYPELTRTYKARGKWP